MQQLWLAGRVYGPSANQIQSLISPGMEEFQFCFSPSENDKFHKDSFDRSVQQLPHPFQAIVQIIARPTLEHAYSEPG